MADETCKEKEYTFVQETIRPKKKSNLKKISFTIAMAVVFGAVSAVVFCLCLPLLSEYFEVNKKQIIIGRGEEFGEVSAVTAAENTPKPTDTPTEEPRKTKDPESDKSEETFTASSAQIQSVCQRVNRSVVQVNRMRKEYDMFSGGSADTGAISGIVVGKSDQNLFIYVCANRIDEKESLFVTFSNNAMVPASIYGKQEELGIVILAVELVKVTKESMATIDIANFSLTDELKPGESVLALGNPNGHLYSLAYGYVSNASYNAYMVDNSITLFNTTIPCNPKGDGVLANMSGEIIGFITHVPGFASNLNYDVNTCYSSATIKPIITKLVNNTAQIYFGIKASDITSEVAYQTGVESGIYLTGVQNNSPAFYADLKKGDIITAIDDSSIRNSSQFNSVINRYQDKDKVLVTFYRSADGKQAKKKVMVEVALVK